MVNEAYAYVKDSEEGLQTTQKDSNVYVVDSFKALMQAIDKNAEKVDASFKVMDDNLSGLKFTVITLQVIIVVVGGVLILLQPKFLDFLSYIYGFLKLV